MILTRRLPAACIVGILLLLSGCAETKLAFFAAKQIARSQDEVPTSRLDRPVKIGKPYQINGVWYYPQDDPDYDETGIASWYGEPFHGRKTASGEIYDMNALTAAHKTLPLPSRVRVTNLENGRSIVVTVNDRGPFVPGRIIDLSRRAAQLLGMDKQGTAKVRVTVLPRAPKATTVAAGKGGNAKKGGEVFVLNQKTITKEEQKKVTAAPQAGVQVATLAPPPGIAAPAAKPAAKASTSPAPTAKTGAQPDGQGTTAPLVEQVPVSGSTNIYVQAGAFTRYENANRLRARLSPLGPVRIDQKLVGDTDYFRVRIGPIDTVEQADALLRKVFDMGQAGARIIVD